MRYSCQFVNHKTGERRDFVSALNAREIAMVAEARKSQGGDELADVLAASAVLKAAYAELNAHEWDHVGRPTPVN